MTYETSLDALINQTFGRLGRNLIGFEPTLRRLANADILDGASGFPPYNLQHMGEHQYRITLAVAGFGMDELDVTVADNKLTISGSTEKRKSESTRELVYKGIAERNFTRQFILADHVSVTGASLENGLLTVDLKHEVPEALKPRKIAIGSYSKPVEQLT
jgi:molecular chaperone IbpA